MTHHSLPLILEPEQLQPRLADPDLLIIDLRTQENYQQGHVPGAVHLSPAELTLGQPPAPGKLPPQERLDALFSRLGLTEQSVVVAYDDEGGGWAGRLLWILDTIGHRHYHYLNGGFPTWQAEGYPLSQEAHEPTARPQQVTLSPDASAEAEYLLSRLGSADLAIWDARSAEEYRGEKVLAARGGHIPGAVNLDWNLLKDRQRHLRLVDLHALQDQLTALGVTPDKEVITHCQTHHRSGLTYLALKALGYPRVRAYPGSWSEWGNRTDLPVEC